MEVVCKENSRTSTGHRKEILVGVYLELEFI